MLFTRYEDYPKFSKLTYCGILSKKCITTKVGKINTERNIKIYQVNIMNTSFERSKQTTDEWYTPKWIVDALGSFDLDPCAPENRLWNTAKRHITPSEDGLKTEWGGGKSMVKSSVFTSSY